MAMMSEPVILDEDRCSPDLDELGYWPRTLWIDPGVTSGWAVVWFDPDKLFDKEESVQRAPVAWWAGMWLGEELGHADACMRLLRSKRVGGEGLMIGVEDFIVRAQRQDRDFLSPVRITAYLRAMLHAGNWEGDGKARRRELDARHRQSASDAKNVINDQRLSSWQMYLPGADHPRDATRHCLLWIRKLRAKGEDFYNQMHFIDDEIEED